MLAFMFQRLGSCCARLLLFILLADADKFPVFLLECVVRVELGIAFVPFRAVKC